jgi:general secretion pathway protein K
MHSPPTIIKHPKQQYRHGQQGVAIITVMLIVMLATAIVSSLFYRESIAIRSIENRLTLQQTRWVERAVLDWSRVILRADAQNAQTAAIDHLQEVWAVPVADTVLDETITAGASIKSDRNSARLSGGMSDGQGKMNLNNLIAEDGSQNTEAVISFEKLLQLTGQPQILARNLLARQMTSVPSTLNKQPVPASTPALITVDDLVTVKGFTSEVIQALDPFVIFLPKRTPININTALAETLAAVLPTLDLATARRLIVQRERTYFKDVAAAGAVLGATAEEVATIPPGLLDVKTSFFIVRGTIKFDRVEASTETLLHRVSARQVDVVWQRRL